MLRLKDFGASHVLMGKCLDVKVYHQSYNVSEIGEYMNNNMSHH